MSKNKCKSLIIVFVAMILLCGCGKDSKDNETTKVNDITQMETDTTIKTDTGDIETPTDYNDGNEITTVQPFDGFSNLKYKEEVIDIPEYALFTSGCMYENKIYYSIDYDCSISMDLISADSGYTSKIYEYNTRNKKYKVIYEAKNGITTCCELSTNGTKLVWTERLVDDIVIYVMNVDGTSREEIYRKAGTNIYIKVTDKYVFWIDDSVDSITSRSLYRYDFETKNTTEIVKNISHGISDAVVCYDNRITIAENKGNVGVISIYDFEGMKIYEYELDTRIIDAAANSKMCVWIKEGENTPVTDTSVDSLVSDKTSSTEKIVEYDYINNNVVLVIYDFMKDKKYELPVLFADIPVLLGKHFVMTDGTQELLSYMIGDKEVKCITNNCLMYGWYNILGQYNNTIYGKYNIDRSASTNVKTTETIFVVTE